MFDTISLAAWIPVPPPYCTKVRYLGGNKINLQNGKLELCLNLNDSDPKLPSYACKNLTLLYRKKFTFSWHDMQSVQRCIRSWIDKNISYSDNPQAIVAFSLQAIGNGKTSLEVSGDLASLHAYVHENCHSKLKCISTYKEPFLTSSKMPSIIQTITNVSTNNNNSGGTQENWKNVYPLNWSPDNVQQWLLSFGPPISHTLPAFSGLNGVQMFIIASSSRKLTNLLGVNQYYTVHSLNAKVENILQVYNISDKELEKAEAQETFKTSVSTTTVTKPSENPENTQKAGDNNFDVNALFQIFSADELSDVKQENIKLKKELKDARDEHAKNQRIISQMDVQIKAMQVEKEQSKVIFSEEKLNQTELDVNQIQNALQIIEESKKEMQEQIQAKDAIIQQNKEMKIELKNKFLGQKKEIEEMQAIIASKDQLINNYKLQIKEMQEQNENKIAGMEAEKQLQIDQESKEATVEGNFNLKHMNNKELLNMRKKSFKTYFYSVAKMADKYYPSFVENGFNDFEIMIEFARMEDKNESLDILCNDCGMNRMHARQLLRRLSQLSLSNSTFEKWFVSHGMSTFYEMMLAAGVVSFAMLENTFVCCTDFVVFLGMQHEQKGIFIWRNIPLERNAKENQENRNKKVTSESPGYITLKSDGDEGLESGEGN